MKGWECDDKPRSPWNACGLSLINPQNLPRLALLACGVVYIAHLMNGGFFYIDNSNLVNFGGCFINGDLFSLCVNGMTVSVVSVMLATVFTLKDFILCGINNCSWMRWMQIVEGVTFLILSVWWIVTAAILRAAWQDSIQMDTASRNSSNSSITVADNILVDTHENKLPTSLGYQLFGISIGCAVSNGFWLLCWFICSQRRKAKDENQNQLSEQPYLGMKDTSC